MFQLSGSHVTAVGSQAQNKARAKKGHCVSLQLWLLSRQPNSAFSSLGHPRCLQYGSGAPFLLFFGEGSWVVLSGQGHRNHVAGSLL